MEVNLDQIVFIVYTNWEGELGIRKILPQKLIFGSNTWHKEEQWLLESLDLDKNAPRTFALKDIHYWTTSKDKAEAFLKRL